MQITFGKHQGKSIVRMLLKEPDYCDWAMSQASPNGGLKSAAKEMNRLIAIINSKPFVRKCQCGKTATRASAYVNSTALMYWCDDCDIYNAGANDGKLTAVYTYGDFLGHGQSVESSTKDDRVTMVGEFAAAKGLKLKPMTQANLDAFFA